MDKLFSIALLALGFASCQSSGDRKVVDPLPSAPITINQPTAPVLDSNNQGTLINTSAGTAALNPEHGAPGHRCDIPVGAPLNSPAGSAPALAPSSQPAPVMKTQATPPPANNNVRLNPAHGAPGHDCTIPVGQPLKS